MLRLKAPPDVLRLKAPPEMLRPARLPMTSPA